MRSPSGPSSPGVGRVGRGEDRREDGEVLRDVVRDRERRQRAARDEELLADLDDLDELRRVRVEVDHVAGLLGRGRARVHRHADVGLGERGGVVRAVAGHRDHPAACLLLTDELELALGRRLGEEVVDAGLLGDDGRGHRVVAGDHDGADAHAAQLVEALVHPALDDVLQVHDAEHPVVLGDDEWRAARLRDAVHERVELARRLSAVLGDEALDRVGGALAEAAAVEVDAAHPRRGGERDELVLAELLLAQPEALLRENDDRAPLGRLVGERGELRGLGEVELVDAADREELGGLPIAERDRARLVQQEHVDVARGLDGPAGHREHVALHEPIHPRDADRREQRADRGRDEGDEQRDEDGLGQLRARRRARTAAGSRRPRGT